MSEEDLTPLYVAGARRKARELDARLVRLEWRLGEIATFQDLTLNYM